MKLNRCAYLLASSALWLVLPVAALADTPPAPIKVTVCGIALEITSPVTITCGGNSLTVGPTAAAQPPQVGATNPSGPSPVTS